MCGGERGGGGGAAAASAMQTPPAVAGFFNDTKQMLHLSAEPVLNFYESYIAFMRSLAAFEQCGDLTALIWACLRNGERSNPFIQTRS